jgi:hypothetical protein
MHPLSWASAFPMVPASGLFILIMGSGVLPGAPFPNKRDFFLVCAVAVATAALVFFGGRLMAPFGNPTPLQLWFLFGSIALEVVLFRLALPKFRRAGERSARLASLFIVEFISCPRPWRWRRRPKTMTETIAEGAR